MKPTYKKWTAYLSGGLLLGFSLYFLAIPAAMIIHDLQDPGLKNGNMPEFTYRWHKHLSGKLGPWAEQRVQSGRAAELDTYDISGTEWPIFGTVFYLWSTESLQQAWEQNPSPSETMPKEYANRAIEAAGKLVSDPNHANWVKQHWGNDYLTRENLFYRMLLISGLSSYQALTENQQYTELLREQVESLARELDNSPHGLLDDYPDQCYPIDILPAIAVIKRADKLLGTDHSEFVSRAVRGFQGDVLDPNTDLPSYVASSRTGKGLGPARGVGASFMLIWAAEIWPEVARDWYTSFERYFWQESMWISGVREFSRNAGVAEWMIDVDAGPVIGGYGTAASAFGIGAARSMNRFDHAYALSAEALASSWPLPDGSLLIPRLVSNATDAPYVGEAALLFSFTRMPFNSPLNQGREAQLTSPHSLPLIVYLIAAAFALLAACGIWGSVRILNRARSNRAPSAT